MTRVTAAKLALGITGIGLFLWANDPDQQGIRWIAVGLVAAAWMLRFVERGSRNPPSQGPSM